MSTSKSNHSASNDVEPMTTSEQPTAAHTRDPRVQAGGLTRREALKASGLALGGLALGGGIPGLLPRAAQAANPCCPEDDCCAGDDQCDQGCCPEDDLRCNWSSKTRAQRYSYYDRLPKLNPFASTATTVQRLDPNAIRITLMGTAIPPRMLSQRYVSVFVEVGWDDTTNLPLDSFVFDCGTGSSGSYNSMNVSFARMNKVFLTHLHGDHMSDLTHIYCFGAASDRKSPLWVWGPGPSGVENPNYQAGGPAPRFYDDGTAAFCSSIRDACRWHSESMSFLATARDPAYPGYQPRACDDPDNFGFGQIGVARPATPAGKYGDDDPSDGYALFGVEMPFDFGGGSNQGPPSPSQMIVYSNAATGVRITAYPVIHCRQGAVAYKLEYRNPSVAGAPTRSMIFTGDTKPEQLTLDQASNGGQGIDVLIHEMGVPPEVWAMKMGRLDDPADLPNYEGAVCTTKKIQNSSHTTQGAFGYLLSQIAPYPGLTVATHFPTADDTVDCAMRSLREHLPRVYQGERPNPPSNAPRVTFAFDLMVITVSTDSKGRRRILEQRGDIDPYGYQSSLLLPPSAALLVPKYHCPDPVDGGSGDPLLQLNSATTLWPCDDQGNCRYRDDGY